MTTPTHVKTSNTTATASAAATRTIANDILFDRKVEAAASGLTPEYSRMLYHKMSQDDALVVCSYIMAMRTECNLSDSYRRSLIKTFFKFCSFFNLQQSVLNKNMTRDNILTFLDSFRRPDAADPMHKWIGTYNLYLVHLVRFFKWLHYPDIEPDKRPKPAVVENIPQLKRREQSIYKPIDLWSPEDDLLFLKYCPSKRMKCYHIVSRDLSARPHEILKLRIREVHFKTTAAGSHQYAEVLVNGKTGSRPIPLIYSLPYLKDYLDNEHPQPGNPNAPLFCGTGKSLGRPVAVYTIEATYSKYRKQLFPKLLENPNVSPEDKPKIKELLNKPFNPYIRRHSALTEKSTILKEHVLRQHAGWSPRSQMHLKYIHYYDGENSKSLLEAYGIINPQEECADIFVLKPKQCPNCNEPNKPDSKFCSKCRMVLTYDAYNETLEKQQEKDSEVQVLKQKYEQDMKAMREEMEDKFQKIFAKIDVATLKDLR
jgi:hypothetical protein